VNISLYSWLVILAMALGANLPFFNQRLFAMVPLKRDAGYVKSGWWRLLEMLILYFVVGAAAYGLEAATGDRVAQGWEFYAINGCLFLVLAFPGFVYAYLYKHKS
jgi:hypothetical protein